ncbi:hypothetical protein ACF3NG_06920 [Aerococcaceae bacterium WGS1372]
MEVRIPEHIRKRAEKALADAWDDKDVNEFIKKNQDVIDDDMKSRADTIILNYVQSKKDPRYRQELVVYAGNIHVLETPNQTAERQMFEDGVLKIQKYDAITRNFNNISDYLDGDMGTIAAERFLANFIENYQYGSKQKGMWLHGEQGIGKTHLMGYFTTLLKMNNIGFTFANSVQLYKDMLEVQRNFSKDVNKNVWKLKGAEVLIVDDLGAEKSSDFMINDVLFEIMDYRMNKGLPTFATSNFTKHDYIEHVLNKRMVAPMDGKRLKERLDTLMTEVQMSGTNRRNKQ